MAKFTKKLTKKEQENLFIEFAQGLASLRSPTEMANFIKDLLSEPETTMLARRLQIARLLYLGLNYREIKEKLSVSYGTIARVQTWMNIYGDGYRTVLERTKKKSEPTVRPSWHKTKRRFPLYYWPELILDDIIKSANKKQRLRLQQALDKLKQKTGLSKQLETILKQSDL